MIKTTNIKAADIRPRDRVWVRGAEFDVVFIEESFDIVTVRGRWTGRGTDYGIGDQEIQIPIARFQEWTITERLNYNRSQPVIRMAG